MNTPQRHDNYIILKFTLTGNVYLMERLLHEDAYRVKCRSVKSEKATGTNPADVGSIFSVSELLGKSSVKKIGEGTYDEMLLQFTMEAL